MVKTNSKKSLIAMIAMVVLLIASIAMGITGAWFTDKESKGQDGSKVTFGSLSVTGSATALQVSDSNGATWTDVGEGTIVMPGDKMKGGHYAFTISCNDTAGAYYLLAQTVGETTTYYTWDSNSKDLKNYESGNLTAVATTETTYAIEFGGSDTAAEIAYNSVSGTNIGNGAQGKEVEAAYAGTYTIYVIQAKNLAADQAASTIKGLIHAEGDFPAVDKTTDVDSGD